MDIRPIKTEQDYRAALKEIEGLMTALPETPEGDRLDVLATLVEAYEAKHYPMEAPDPVDAIKFQMEQSGLTPKDLVASIGKTNRVYEVLNHKRSLTIEMIRKLHENLNIPLKSLIGVSRLPKVAIRSKGPAPASAKPKKGAHAA